MIYIYWIAQGVASLHKLDAIGCDVDQKTKENWEIQK